MRFDAVIITTIRADTLEEGESLIRDFADGLALEYHAPFTGIVDGGDYDNDEQRVFYLHPLYEQSECGGADEDWHLTKEDLI